MSLLDILGKSPMKSFRFFITGFSLFAFGIICLYAGNYLPENYSTTVQYIALFFIGIGCILAIIGYIGLFAARLLVLFNRGQR